MVSYSDRRTPGGYAIGECISALQKAIRRGQVKAAVYWALEIDATDKGARTWLWNRLAVILSEDIGSHPSNVGMVADLAALRNFYEDGIKRRNGSYLLFLAHAVSMLCFAQRKSRIVDEVLVSAMGSDRIEIPDEALDTHTSTGRRMGRGIEHFVREATRIEQVEEEDFDRLEKEFRFSYEEIMLNGGAPSGYPRPWERGEATKPSRSPSRPEALL